jgi:hypothetical protein
MMKGDNSSDPPADVRGASRALAPAFASVARRSPNLYCTCDLLKTSTAIQLPALNGRDQPNSLAPNSNPYTYHYETFQHSPSPGNCRPHPSHAAGMSVAKAKRM